MKTLFILNDPPYGTERSFTGRRLAKTLAGKEAEVTVSYRKTTCLDSLIIWMNEPTPT
jgi:sulfur relay (sulfurtransferase) complex TusBCD TusD component (DsrE family)